eukprot:971305_1
MEHVCNLDEYVTHDLSPNTASTKRKFNRYKGKMGNKMKQQLVKLHLQRDVAKEQPQQPMTLNAYETESDAHSAIYESEKTYISKTKHLLNSQCVDLEELANIEVISANEQKKSERLTTMAPRTEIPKQIDVTASNLTESDKGDGPVTGDISHINERKTPNQMLQNTMEANGDEHSQLVLQLEDIVNKEMSDLISLYSQHMDFEQLLATDTDRITSCPLSDCHPSSNVPTTNANDQGNNNQTQNNGNNNDEDGRNGSNNNDDNGDEDEKDMAVSQPSPCNHLSTCSHCSLGWTRKCVQIKMFKALLVSLQAQHAHHVAFVETLCKTIANAKQKGNKKAKKRRNTLDAVAANQPSYDPPFGATQKLKVKIPKTVTEDIIPQIVQEPIASQHMYSYVNKSIVMQRNDKQLSMEKDNVVVNLDFHETKSSESLYCVMSKIQHQRYDWQLEDKVYTADELDSMGIVTLPQSSRIACQKSNSLSTFRFNAQSVNDIMQRCKWNTISVYNITNNTKKKKNKNNKLNKQKQTTKQSQSSAYY